MVANQTRNHEIARETQLRSGPGVVARPRRAVGDHPHCGRLLTTKVGLQIPADMTFEDWEQAGRKLSGILDSSSWWLGDWLVYGKDHYTDLYQRGIRAAGLSYQTLRNYAWVSRRFEFHRRRSALSFQHHAELASLPLAEQELWLDRAEEMKWTTKQLRNAIRDVRAATEGQDGRQAEATRRLAVPGDRIQWWHKAAEQSGIDFEQWVLATLDNAAERVLEDVEEQTAVSA
ncbi:LmbU family transcriptional regulator [Embleya sp. NPDC059213]